MHDIWNPWHGCVKISEGCENCYMYFLDSQRGMDGSKIFRTKNGFDYPLQKDRRGNYKVKSGEKIRVCMTSDFFLPEADEWRPEAWEIMRLRSDVIFFLLTKRPQRIAECLPPDWGGGWENIFMNVTAENQRRADERIPILLSLPFKHKGVMCAPFIGEVSLKSYLATGQLEQVLCDGENYSGARPCNYDWVKRLHDECVEADVTFVFCGTGRRFIKDGRLYKIEGNGLQSDQAFKSGLSYKGREAVYDLYDAYGYPVPKEARYVPFYSERCRTCGMKLSCNGCSKCGRCGQVFE